MDQTTLSLTQNELFILVVILLVITLVTLALYFSVKKKLTSFMKGSDGKSLEHTLLELLHKVRELEEEAKKDKKEMTLIKEHVRSLVRTPEILRFKADGGASSNQSFSLALLDSEGNGTALTTLHVRDRVSFYGKNIKKWTGDTELTDEEKEVIERVKKNEK